MISVLIPTLNDAAVLPRALQPLVPAAIDGLVVEVIVIDAGSTDATLEIADDAGCRLLEASGDARTRVAAGARIAKGDWLLILESMAWLPEGWDRAARDHIKAFPDRRGRFPGAGEGLLDRLGFGAPPPTALLVRKARFGADGAARPMRLKAKLLPTAL